MDLTTNETAFLRHLMADDFIRDSGSDYEAAATYSDGIEDGFTGNAPGTIASLIKKGVLVKPNTELLGFTAVGAVIARSLAAE